MTDDPSIKKVMAELFGNTSETSKSSDDDYDVFSGDSDGQSFEQKSKDLQLIIEKDPQEDVFEEVDEDVEKVVKKSEEPVSEVPVPTTAEKPETAVTVPETASETAPKQKETDILEEAENDPSFAPVTEENPLGLIGIEFDNFKVLRQKYSNFAFFDGNVLTRPFYRTKCEQLSYVLAKYPLLDIGSINDEIKSIKLDYSIKGIPSGDVIADKLNRLIRQRERLSEILVQLHQQLPVWKAVLEMLKGKLWCIKDVKGQHKREGIVADHMPDVVYYVSGVESALDAAKYLDGVLVSNGDSLSRQLACIQEKRVHDTISIGDDNIKRKPVHDVSDIGSVFVDREDELSAVG